MKTTMPVLLLTTLLSASASESPFWRAGHLLVGDPNHFTGADVIDIDPHTRGVRVLPGAAEFSSGVAFSEIGDLFVTDGGRGQILVMRNTNNFFEPLSTTPMEKPLGLALASNGDLYTTVSEPFAAVIRVRADTGEASVISSGPPLYQPVRIALSRRGDLYVSNYEMPDEETGVETNDLLRIDPKTGARTVITSDGFLRQAGIMAVDGNDDVIMADQRAGLIKVDTTTGRQTVLLSTPVRGVAIDGAGGAYITRGDGDLAAVYHLNFSTRAIRTVTTNVALWHPTDITVAPCARTLLSNLVPCEAWAGHGPWSSRGDYVSTLVKTVTRLTREKIITPAEGRDALLAALTSQCGPFEPRHQKHDQRRLLR
jgi:sugar lactone lactonase YvrE